MVRGGNRPKWVTPYFRFFLIDSLPVSSSGTSQKINMYRVNETPISLSTR